MTEHELDADDRYQLKLEGRGVTISRDVDAATASEIIALVVGGPTEGRAGKSVLRTGKTASSRPASSQSRAHRKVGSPNIVRNMSLRPDGKQPFVDFAAEKQPANHAQKQVVVLFWLTREAGMTSGITVDHVNTCYAEGRWPRPGDLRNSLSLTSARKGWIETTDMNDLRLTTRGEDEVLHYLPPSRSSPR